MTTSQTTDGPAPAYNSDFSSTGAPPNSVPMYMPPQQPMYVQQPMYMPPQQQQQQPMYMSQPMYAPQSVYPSQPQMQMQMQPMYVSQQPQTIQQSHTVVMQQQQQQPVVTRPVVMTRKDAINAKLHLKHCCCCFSYPTGVKVMALLEAIVWIIWALVSIINGLWWIWFIAAFALSMCYFAVTGADNMNEKFLRYYMYYLGAKAILYVALIYVFAALGYDVDIFVYACYAVLLAYWYYIVRDFANTIHEFDEATKHVSQPQP